MPPDPLDIEQPAALEAYLRRTNRLGASERVETRTLAGGVSNRTVRVRFPDRTPPQAWVLKQALAKLRVAVDWFSDPARIGREAEGLRRLARLAPPGSIPPLVFEDPENHLLSMEAVPEPHENLKAVWMAGRGIGHVRPLGQLLGTIHRRGWEQREALSTAFDDRQFFRALRLEPYYEYAAGRAPEAAGFLRELIAATLGCRLTLVHGDYSPKNVLVHDGRLVLLDFEVIHFGDPAFDAGFALAHLLSKAHHLVHLRFGFVLAAVEFWRQYEAALGDVPWATGLEARAVRHAIGCLLARAAGRSPLEYLTPSQRRNQQASALALTAAPPHQVRQLADRFCEELNACPSSSD